MKKLTIANVKSSEILSKEERKMVVGGDYGSKSSLCPEGQFWFSCTVYYYGTDNTTSGGGCGTTSHDLEHKIWDAHQSTGAGSGFFRDAQCS